MSVSPNTSVPGPARDTPQPPAPLATSLGRRHVNRLFQARRSHTLQFMPHLFVDRAARLASSTDGQSKRPAAKTIERVRRIRCALPGAITNSAILVLIFSPPPTFLINLFQVTWLHSADTTLTEIGDQMSINYRARYSYYLQHIVEALANSPDGADGSAGREIEEDNNFFAGAHASPVAPHSFFHIAASPPSHTLPTLSATYPCSILEQAGAGKLRVDFAQRPFPFPAVFAAPQRGPTSLLNAWCNTDTACCVKWASNCVSPCIGM
ncbi:hypothetical protein B0H14DRAFT_2592765 [Mycena olivaceomarginata]|nr:hypothetical protein B0H14DRAFT_2592765 [Mycena olivaceomarginata]